MIVRGVRILGQGEPVDVEVDDAVIRSIAPSGTPATPGTERIMLPGLVDLHTHLREPGQEEAETVESGTRAAAAGGFTDVFAMPNTDPPTDSVERVRALRHRIDAGSSARVHVIGAATEGRAGRALVDVAAMVAEGVRVFSDDGSCLDDAVLVERMLAETTRHGAVFAQHAQSRELAGDGVVHSSIAEQLGVEGWPAAGEEAVIERDLRILAETGGRLHVCHLSTRGAVELVRAAKAKGLPVTAEVTPHHLVLRDQDVLHAGAALKVNPPLREAADIAAVRQGLRDGTIDIVATDHAPHPARSKSQPLRDAAFGLTGLESALGVVAEVLSDDAGAPDWAAIARVLASRPAEIGSLPPALVSRLRVGDPATFCVVETRGTPLPLGPTRSRSANSPFAHHSFRSRVTLTVLEGRETFRETHPDGSAPGEGTA